MDTASGSTTDSFKGPLLGLFRHGPAERRDAVRYPVDDLRPLTAKGRKRVQACARGMKAAGFVPDTILYSPALRTQESAFILAKTLGLTGKKLRMEPALHYDTDPRILVAAARNRKRESRTLWVGHEPWLGEAIGFLLGGPPLPLRKGGFALVATGTTRAKAPALVASLPPDWLSRLR